MTAIVISKLGKNKCIVASDRRISDGKGTIYIDAHPKVQKLHGCLVGSAGDVAPYEVFLTLGCLQGFEAAEDKMKFLLYVVLPKFKKALKVLSLTEEDTPLGMFDTDIIICHKGKCYNIAINAQHGVEVVPVSLPAGFGCGGTLGLVAYKALQYGTVETSKEFEKTTLTTALELVAEHDNACDNNIDITIE